MAVTSNYGWTYPDVGGSNGAWGGVLNALFTAVDASLKTVENLASAALAKAGGVMTGRLDMKTASMAVVAKGSISGAQAFDIAVAQYFTLTVGGALTPSFTNVPAGSLAQGVIFRITNGGAFAITWPGSVKWVSGVAPTLTAAGVDLLGFITDDNGATWRGLVLGKDIR
jgi:hypothetical protein